MKINKLKHQVIEGVSLLSLIATGIGLLMFKLWGLWKLWQFISR